MDSGKAAARCEPVWPRVLIVVHGHEPAGWIEEACRAVSLWVNPLVRVIAIPDVPSPPFTSLTSFARRAFDEARREWTTEEETRVQGVIDQMIPLLPDSVEVAWVHPRKGNFVAPILDQVGAWSADVIVLAAPAPGIRSRLSPGPIVERLLHHANCAVLIPPVQKGA